jgi:hypothetical protein
MAVLTVWDTGHLMRHEDRNRCPLQEGLGCAAQPEFQQPRMAISTHDQEIRTELRSMHQKNVANILLAEGNLGYRRDAVPGKVCRQFRRVRIRMHMALSIGIKCQQGDSLSCPEQRHRIADGTRRLSATVPCHEDLSARVIEAAASWYNENRRPGIDNHLLRGGEGCLRRDREDPLCHQLVYFARMRMNIFLSPIAPVR